MKVYIVRTIDKNWNKRIRGIFESYNDASMFGMIYFGKEYEIEECPVRRFKVSDMSKPGGKDYES